MERAEKQVLGLLHKKKGKPGGGGGDELLISYI
jgi:hypothetical protein